MAKTKSKKAAAFQSTAINAAVRGGGAIAGAMVGSKVLPMIFKDPESPLRKHAGLIILVGGIALEAMAPDDKLRTLGAGMSTFGVLRSANDYMPDNLKATINLGLSGVDGLEAVEFDWNKFANEASTAMDGNEEMRLSAASGYTAREYHSELDGADDIEDLDEDELEGLSDEELEGLAGDEELDLEGMDEEDLEGLTDEELEGLAAAGDFDEDNYRED